MRFAIWQGESEHYDWVFLGQDLAIGPFPWKWSSAAYIFVFESRKIQNKHDPSAL